MKKWSTRLWELSYTQKLCLIMSLVFILSLFPLIHIGMYAHSVGDDYSYGLSAHLAWENTGSIPAVIQAALENTRQFYNSWQGTYSSIFLMSLQPAIISERLYPLTCILMLGMLIGSHFFFFRILFTYFLKLKKSVRILLTLSVLFLSIQVLDAPGEAFFWYNGAVHYVFMYSCMIFLMGLLLLFLKDSRRWLKAVYLFLAVLGGLFLGGSNYVTALSTPILICGLLLCCVFRKEKQGLFLLLPFLASAGGLLLNMTAPGNAVRMSMQTASMTAPEAIYQSFLYAVSGIGDWSTLYVVFFVILLIPVLIPALAHTDFDFPYPGIVAAVSFCVIAATFTPSLYSMGHVIIFDRTLNIMRMTYYLLLILNLVYSLGWLVRKLQGFDSAKALPQILTGIGEGYTRSFSCFLILFFLCLLLFSNKNELTTLSAIHSLKEGYAQSYHEETLNRISLLSMEGVDEVWVPNYTVRPYLLDLEDISTDPSNWRNEAMANWYGKKVVHLSEIY